MVKPQPIGPIQANPQAASEAPAGLSTQNDLPPTTDPEPFAVPEGPVSVAEVMNSIQPPIQGFPTRFHSLLTLATDVPPAVDRPNAEALYNVPIVVTPKVEGHMRFFHTSIRDRFEQWLLRLGKYKKQVEDIFSEFDLPSDLVFLSLVESGFNPHAYSRARATGPWQFMQGTAKMYGLRMDQYVDERRDPIKSTVAAAQYLRDLYDLFGAWPLAMAAYNAGEGKVMRALQKTQAKSFSEIAQTMHLKKETKEYVPRFMAATIIAKNPDRYGFPLVEPVPHQFEEVVVGRSLHLRDIAATTGVSYDDLERLNPELRRSITPPSEDYPLKVPVGARATVESLLDGVKTWRGPLPSMKKSAARSEWYKVRVGDTLPTIAKRFRLSVPDLKAKSHLAAHYIVRPGDRLRIGP
jgi:membrane-bound lytic murein transglycosylase D